MNSCLWYLMSEMEHFAGKLDTHKIKMIIPLNCECGQIRNLLLVFILPFRGDFNRDCLQLTFARIRSTL